MSDFYLGNEPVKNGERKTIYLDVARLYDYTTMRMPVHVIHGREHGPTMFITAAIHGDEINGTEIIRRLLRIKRLNSIKGTLIVIPVVNVFGFNSRSRYLPDRRDLNRSFPGSEKGSLTARLAHLIMTEIVEKADYGIDLHTGAIHRDNLPQIRADLESFAVEELADAFAAPVSLHAKYRDGSLREAAEDAGVVSLLYETGEALRFDEKGIRIGVKGIVSVMESISMLDEKKASNKVKKRSSFKAASSHWVRAPNSGIFSAKRKIGDIVKPGDVMGTITDPMGTDSIQVKSRAEGVIIGGITMPLLNRGDAIFHVATVEDLELAEEVLDDFSLMN